MEQVLARFNPPWPAVLYIGEGWYPIVEELDAQLSAIDPDYTIAQVKEKFGGLRFYPDVITGDRDNYNALINAAEEKAAKTCDVCGGGGTLRTKRLWYSTRCDEHEDLV